MSMLPEAKLDILLAHHAELEAELLGQVNSENYVRITRELAELNPLIDAVKAYRATTREIAEIDTLIADPASEPEMRGMAAAISGAAFAEIPEAGHLAHLEAPGAFERSLSPFLAATAEGSRS